MSTSYGHYTSGWCGSCGRKRGSDGRCANCDPWWSSPLIQYGAPLIAGVSLLLLLGTSLARQQSRNDDAPHFAPTAFTTTPVSASTPRFRSPGSPTGYGFPAMPVGSGAISAASMGPAIPILRVTPADANRPSLEELQRRDQEELRRMTAYVDSVIQADDNVRAQQARNYGGAAFASSASVRPVAMSAESMSVAPASSGATDATTL